MDAGGIALFVVKFEHHKKICMIVTVTNHQNLRCMRLNFHWELMTALIYLIEGVVRH